MDEPAGQEEQEEQEAKEREEKLAAYEAIGSDDEHLEAIRASVQRAVEAGVL